MKMHLTDFVDYEVPISKSPPRIAQYAIAPYNFIPHWFGGAQSILGVAPRRLRLSVLPLATGDEQSSEPLAFAVKCSCPIAYMTVTTNNNPAVTAGWDAQTTLVTPSAIPRFVNVGSWNFKDIPKGAVPQVVNVSSTDDNAAMGLVCFQMLNLDSESQFFVKRAFRVQFKVDLDFDLPLPALSKAKTSFAMCSGTQFWRSVSPSLKPAESLVCLKTTGFVTTPASLPSLDTGLGLLQLLHLEKEQAMEDSFVVLSDDEAV